MKTLFLSPLQPQNAAGGGGGGGVGGVSRLRFPPGPTSEAAVSADTHAFARLPPGGLRLGAWAPSFLETWPTGPWGLDPATLTGAESQAELRLKPMIPGLKTLGCYHNPQSADLGERWMVSEGGALQFHERFPSLLQHFSR